MFNFLLKLRDHSFNADILAQQMDKLAEILLCYKRKEGCLECFIWI